MNRLRFISKKRLLPLFCMIVLVLVHSLPVFAAEEKEDLGSIKIELTDGGLGTSKENVVFEYQKVADLKGGFYYLKDKFKATGIDLNALEYAKDMDEAAHTLSKFMESEGQVITDSDGHAFITDLEIGVYLLAVSDKARYEEVTPVLIAIPTWNEIEGDMDYHVTVIPKHSPNKPGSIITDTPSVPGGGVQTGDDSEIMPLCVLLGMSALLIVAAAKKRNKREQEV